MKIILIIMSMLFLDTMQAMECLKKIFCCCMSEDNGVSKYYSQLLHSYAQDGNVKQVHAIIAAKHEIIDDADEEGRTALHLASLNKKKAMVLYLISQGADQQKIKNTTALNYIRSVLKEQQTGQLTPEHIKPSAEKPRLLPLAKIDTLSPMSYCARIELVSSVSHKAPAIDKQGETPSPSAESFNTHHQRLKADLT